MVETDKGVHQWLARQGFLYYQSQIKGSELASYVGVYEQDGVFVDVRQATVLDGVRDEDKASKPPLFQGTEGGYDLDAPVNRHFCASAKNLNKGLFFLIQYDSAFVQAEKIWSGHAGDNLLARWSANDKATAYYYLGHVAHLVHDMTVPAHTHCDPHGGPGGSLFDAYEQGYCAYEFGKYRYDDALDGEPILGPAPVAIPASLYDLFYETAEYTDDYDSNDANGDFANSGLEACYFPEDFPSARLHRPQDAVRTGTTLDTADCQIIAEDLLYWAMHRTAALYRYFYRTVDTTPFSAFVREKDAGAALSQNESAPTAYAGPNDALLTVCFTVPGRTYPVSGIVRDSMKVYYAFRPEGGAWQEEQAISVTSEEDDFSLRLYPGLYRFRAAAESGAGISAQESEQYLSVPGLRFVEMPRSGWYDLGSPLALEVVVAGESGVLSYQWEKDGEDIPGAIEPLFSIAMPTASDSGVYRCRVNDDESKGVIATPPIYVRLIASGSVPAMNGVGLALLLVIFACLVRRCMKNA